VNGRRPYRVLLVDEEGALPLTASALFASGELVSCLRSCHSRELLAVVRAETPDVIVMEMSPGEAVFTGIEQVMAERPTPILLLDTSKDHVDHKEDVFRAMALGALDAVTLPDRPRGEFWDELTKKIALLSQVRVVRHVQGRRKRSEVKSPSPDQPAFPLVAIASSLGGPKALSLLLKLLPAEFPAAVVICQHISEGFTAGLAQWLASESRLQVVEARDGQALRPGAAYIAPSGCHLLVRPEGVLKLDSGPPLMGFRPSCDALLMTAAEIFHRRCSGVILTGMGKDGARGMLEIQKRGGHTIAQDEASCVVYGMPKEAVLLGAVAESLPLEGIAQSLKRWVLTC
jgi:two-component system, chemotaxis family, protein-glutamate methylesterase/glutaminase